MATGSRRRGRVRRVLGGDLLLGVLLLGALGLGAVLLAPPFEDYVNARQRVALLEQQALALEAENLRLERRIADLDDPVTIELLARSQQGLVRPGEVPYVLIAPEVDAPRILDVAEQDAPEEDVLDRILAWIRARLG
jgi:cell division protein FtsB